MLSQSLAEIWRNYIYVPGMNGGDQLSSVSNDDLLAISDTSDGGIHKPVTALNLVGDVMTSGSVSAILASLVVTGSATLASADINGGTIDGTIIGATTPAAATVTSLVASGAVSTGALTVGGTLVSNDGNIQRNVSSSTMALSGGSGPSDGAALILYGSTDANAGDFTLQTNGSAVVFYDHSASQIQVTPSAIFSNTVHIAYTDDTGTSGLKLGTTGIASGYIFSDDNINIDIDHNNNSTGALFNITKDGGTTTLYSLSESGDSTLIGNSAVSGTLLSGANITIGRGSTDSAIIAMTDESVGYHHGLIAKVDDSLRLGRSSSNTAASIESILTLTLSSQLAEFSGQVILPNDTALLSRTSGGGSYGLIRLQPDSDSAKLEIDPDGRGTDFRGKINVGSPANEAGLVNLDNGVNNVAIQIRSGSYLQLRTAANDFDWRLKQNGSNLEFFAGDDLSYPAVTMHHTADAMSWNSGVGNQTGYLYTDSNIVGIFNTAGAGAGREGILIWNDRIELDINASTKFTLTATTATFAGALAKGSGSFKIDHPLMPDTHYLVHSFVESPRAENLYTDMVQLVDGEATVNIDENSNMLEGTYEALNRSRTWNCTNTTGHTSVTCNLKGNVLTIECEDPNSSDLVCWEVRGERRDKHMLETTWTDNQGRVITEPLKEIYHNV